MTPDECARIVLHVNTIDPFVTRNMEPEVATLRLGYFMEVLDEVPYEFAQDWCRRKARAGVDRPVQASDIRDAWLERQRVQEAKGTRRREPEQIGLGAVPHGAPPWFKPYHDYVAARHRSLRGRTLEEDRPWIEQWCRDNGHPQPVWPAAPDVQERRCRYWQHCSCAHTRCRDGWLDEEQPVVRNGQVRDTMGVVRCPACEEAMWAMQSKNAK